MRESKDLIKLQELTLSLNTQSIELSMLMEYIPDGIIILDSKGIIYYVNKPLCSIFGYDKEELLGRTPSFLAPPPISERHDEYMHKFFVSSEANILGLRRIVNGIRKNGEIFSMYLVVNQVNMLDKIYYIGLIIDMSKIESLRKEKFENGVH
jgi:two-component system, LuxR family, sensor kinase FixL